MRRWQKTLIFLVGLFFFALFALGIGAAASWWNSVQVGVCGTICSQDGDATGVVFWVQIIGLVLVSICGITWIMLPEEEEAARG
jgi:hypothetical protein